MIGGIFLDVDGTLLSFRTHEIPASALDALTRAIGRLDPQERALVTLFYYEERSVAECAAITALSESNVKVRLHRIRKKLYVMVTAQKDETK